MSESESRLPDWRDHPGAVSEGIFYISSMESDAGPHGKSKFSKQPMHGGDGDTTAKGVYAKGDYVPDLDYAAFSAEVFNELHTVLSDYIDVEEYDEGSMLLRFAAFNRQSNWTVEASNDIIEHLESVPLRTLAVGVEDNTRQEETPPDEPEQQYDDADREAMQGEFEAIEQLHGDVTPDLIRDHSPRPPSEYADAFGSLEEAIALYEDEQD